MSIRAMSDDELDAELDALDTQERTRAVVAYVLNRCALCKMPDRHMDRGFCAPCIEKLNNNTRTI